MTFRVLCVIQLTVLCLLFPCLKTVQGAEDADPALALSEARANAEKNPGKLESYYNLGIAYTRMAQYGAARDAFKEALRLNPDSPEAHYGLGVVYFLQDNGLDFLDELRILKKLNPVYADSLYKLLSDNKISFPVIKEEGPPDAQTDASGTTASAPVRHHFSYMKVLEPQTPQEKETTSEQPRETPVQKSDEVRDRPPEKTPEPPPVTQAQQSPEAEKNIQDPTKDSTPSAEARPDPSHAQDEKTPDKYSQNIQPAGIAKPLSEIASKVYSVQVGYFRVEQNALSMVSDLKLKGIDAYVKKEVHGSTLFFRTLTGNFQERTRAVSHAGTVEKKTGIRPLIHTYYPE